MLFVGFTMADEGDVSVSQEELEGLILAIADGNKNALAALYENTNTAVYGFSLSILKNTHDAQDVLQDTYIKVFANAKRYIPQGKPMAWIFTITRNLCLMKLRDGKKTTEDPVEERVDIGHDTREALEDKIVLKKVIESLPSPEREIIVMHAVSGLKHREIADILDIPLSTVLSKYNRTIKKLKLLLKEEYGEQNSNA